jgi:hypothetical protein
MKRLVIVIFLLLISSPAFAQAGWKEFTTNDEAKYQGLNLSFLYPDQFAILNEGNYTVFIKFLDQESAINITLEISTLPRSIFREFKDLSNTQIGMKLSNEYYKEGIASSTIYSTEPITHASYPGFIGTASTITENSLGEPDGSDYKTSMRILVENKTVTVTCGVASIKAETDHVSNLYEKHANPVCGHFFKSLKIN